MNYILFDDNSRNTLLPLTFMRPVADIRIGILTIREKWEHHLNTKTSTLTEVYLSEKYPIVRGEENILINGSINPSPELVEKILDLKPKEILVGEDYIIAMRLSDDKFDMLEGIDATKEINTDINHFKLNHPWEIFQFNGESIIMDFVRLTKNRTSEPISPTNNILGQENIFIEKGAKIEFATLNATAGPIYIGKNAEIMENAVIRGPFALCENSTVKIGAKIYGPTTIGPWSKVAGEISNSVIFGYSNKAHDGFMGNSVIAEWCNLGSDTNTSNLKNTYEKVRIWSYSQKSFIDTGLTFCGLIMGDHSKCGINTMFNTGSVVGINSSIFGSGYQRNFISSFKWGGPSGFTKYDLEKAIKVARIVYERRGLDFDEVNENLFRSVFDTTAGTINY
ncbi:MAG: GlmU family protein [Bacteroidales bacterium]|jgi:UDP-N-acetylglucosamine diphosphorylase/glucosamine-1-phosphate N-acetyltransferase|nr:GlmU family protein [Bacteroidales bacterium]